MGSLPVAGAPLDLNPSPHSGRALAALVLGGVLLGCSPILVRLSHIGPIATAFWRLALALVPLVLLFGRVTHSGNAGARAIFMAMPLRCSPRASTPAISLC